LDLEEPVIDPNEPISLWISKELAPALQRAVAGVLPGMTVGEVRMLDNGRDGLEIRAKVIDAPKDEAPASLEGLEVSDSNFGEFVDSGGTL
jgi:hypothetical protein